MSISSIRLDATPISLHRRTHNGGSGGLATLPSRVETPSRTFWKGLEWSERAAAAFFPPPPPSANPHLSFPAAVAAVEAPIRDEVDRIGELSQVLAVLGSQWGGKGKGKLMDILAQYFNIIARCQLIDSFLRLN